ncbi:hypothetical protein [Mesorhizobium temperatum]|uniref:hypothetical protein n=1 Tax=Mesorhizobium temperatum TaxID=241416 RepID=UPI00142E134C|nr:hypothetical protein [Mesorhizobium temperatum]
MRKEKLLQRPLRVRKDARRCRASSPKVETGFGKNPMLKHKDSAAARFDPEGPQLYGATRGNIKRNAPFPAAERRLVQPDRRTDVDAALGHLLKDA